MCSAGTVFFSHVPSTRIVNCFHLNLRGLVPLSCAAKEGCGFSFPTTHDRSEACIYLAISTHTLGPVHLRRGAGRFQFVFVFVILLPHILAFRLTTFLTETAGYKIAAHRLCFRDFFKSICNKEEEKLRKEKLQCVCSSLLSMRPVTIMFLQFSFLNIKNRLCQTLSKEVLFKM